MGRGFSGTAFARRFFGLAVASFVLSAGPAIGQQEPPNAQLGNSGPALGNGQTASPAAGPEVKKAPANPVAEAAPPAEEEAASEKPKAAAPKEDAEKAQSAPATATAAATLAAGEPDTGGSSSNGILSPSIPTFGADGALRYGYSIDVPAFRGLEPAISLNYDSGRKTKLNAGYQGWLGFGWGLDGFDVIERQRPRGGVPAFDANDVYLLNGSELVPCTPNMDSPSCTSGGNYATEVESYQRIRHDAAGNVWNVTQRDGTVLQFYSMASFPTATLSDSNVAYYSRWLLRSVRDTHNNTVVYDYDCTDGTVCYPKTVSFGPYQIAFNLETRPDHILMANGRTIAKTTKRIKSVKVTAGGAMVGAWALAYDQAPASNNSRLSHIYRFGSDAVINLKGVVTNGSSLPPVTFQYRDFGTGSYAAWEKTITSECTDALKAERKGLTFADIDNNGNDELVHVKDSRCNSIVGKKCSSTNSHSQTQPA